ncbi:hypothetical protein INT45_013580 [Circinella minor]|uniref:F-box domain-containing protein n=1 Tax=Circinella minor TaxID=1195481 RepID=A0A8H7RQU1_9FUNG|nr:hypothetical protein INT45_013580 [Circinella minor]
MTQTLDDIMSQMTLNKEVDQECHSEMTSTLRQQQSHYLAHYNQQWHPVATMVTMTTREITPYYQIFDDVIKLAAKRIDFITLLPYEMASVILEKLTLRDLLECINVSREWHTRILNTPSLWHEITITDDQYPFIPMLTRIGEHIQKYMIYNCRQKIIRGSLNMMFYGCMSNVKTLKLILYADQDHLYSPPHYLAILSVCPNLKRLSVSLPHSHMALLDDPPVLPRNNNLELTHLNWTTGSFLTQEDIHPLLLACPKLRYLQLGCFAGVMDLVFNPGGENSSQLRYLSIDSIAESCEPDLDYWDDDDYEQDNEIHISPSEQQSFLRALSLHCTDVSSWNIIKVVLSQEKNVLEKLTVYHDYDGFDAGHLIQNFRGNLLNLYGSDGWTECAELDATLISHEDVSDSDHSTPTTPTALTSISYPRLWHIHATYNLADKEDDIAALIIALRNNTRSNKLSSSSHRITRLRLAKVPAYGEIILPLILELPSLQAIKLEQCLFYTETLIQFAKQLANRKRDTSPLNYLGFNTVHGLTDDVVMELANVPGLKKIKLSQCDYLTDKSICNLVNQSVLSSSSNLEDLDLFQCKQVTWDTVNYVQDILDEKRYYSGC